MSNLLYIGYLSDKASSGADVVNLNNIEVLKSLYKSSFFEEGLDNTDFWDKILLYTGGLSRKCRQRILISIETNNIDVVFLSSSLLGKLAKVVKRKYPNIRIISFYHNVERQYAAEQLKVSGLSKFATYILLTYNEKLSSKYSDYNILLNNRDRLLFQRYYKRDADLIIPIFFKDVFDVKTLQISKYIYSSKPIALFVGSSFFANVEGMKWYLAYVHPFVDEQLIIVGKNMDRIFSSNLDQNYQVYGYIPDLSELYYNADFVIAPIFSGGGMKTKTAEAFMYGKSIIGTKEAFEGYIVSSDYAIECNTASQFIDAINSLISNPNRTSFNKYAREYYLAHHSFNSIIKLYWDFLSLNSLL